MTIENSREQQTKTPGKPLCIVSAKDFRMLAQSTAIASEAANQSSNDLAVKIQPVYVSDGASNSIFTAIATIGNNHKTRIKCSNMEPSNFIGIEHLAVNPYHLLVASRILFPRVANRKAELTLHPNSLEIHSPEYDFRWSKQPKMSVFIPRLDPSKSAEEILPLSNGVDAFGFYNCANSVWHSAMAENKAKYDKKGLNQLNIIRSNGQLEFTAANEHALCCSATRSDGKISLPKDTYYQVNAKLFKRAVSKMLPRGKKNKMIDLVIPNVDDNVLEIATFNGLRTHIPMTVGKSYVINNKEKLIPTPTSSVIVNLHKFKKALASSKQEGHVVLSYKADEDGQELLAVIHEIKTRNDNESIIQVTLPCTGHFLTEPVVDRALISSLIGNTYSDKGHSLEITASKRTRPLTFRGSNESFSFLYLLIPLAIRR